MMMNNCLQLAVIGAGASGLMAAVTAAAEAEKIGKNVSVALYEANPRVGKKLLVTGNGRCNFTNDFVSGEHFYGERALAAEIYKRFDNEQVKKFFLRLGLVSKSDFAGRVYPLSAQASSVLDALRFEVMKYGIKEVCDTKITSIEKNGNTFLLNGKFRADRCIIATGGKAAPVQGSDGSGLELLKKAGIKITPVVPALTALCCADFTKALKGIRAQGKITIKASGRILAEDTGEIQYTDYGLSGIPSMQVSRFVSEALLQNKSEVFAIVDSCPALSSEELADFISSVKKNNPFLPSEMLLAGIMPKRLGISLLFDCSVNPSMEIGKIYPAATEKIVRTVKGKKYKIQSVRGFSDAQVSAGGIAGEEIDYSTLELKKLRGAYVCGEIVNVDGACGGYNLQWAWSSGVTAGKSAVREN